MVCVSVPQGQVKEILVSRDLGDDKGMERGQEEMVVPGKQPLFRVVLLITHLGLK